MQHPGSILINESWLTGDVPAEPNHSNMTGAVYFARQYFKGWHEEEIRELWNDLDTILVNFIETEGKRAYLVNPITIFSNEFMLTNFRPFKSFYKKWLPKFETIEAPAGEKIYLSSILLAVYILKSAAAKNNIQVIDAYDRLSYKENQTKILINTKKTAISNHCKSISKMERTSTLTFLLKLILHNRPNYPRKKIADVLNEHTNKKVTIEEQAARVIITNVSDTHITWLDWQGNSKRTKISALPTRLSKLSKKISLAC